MKLFFVCGKGGSGKTTFATSLTQYYATSEGVLFVTIDQPFPAGSMFNTIIPSYVPSQISKNCWAVHLDRQNCLDQAILKNLPIKFLTKQILNFPAYPLLSSIIPGIRELLVMYQLAKLTSQKFKAKWKTVIVDTPPTGHGLNLLTVNTNFKRAFSLGPLSLQINNRSSKSIFSDSVDASMILITTAEKIPVQETIEYANALESKTPYVISQFVVNKIGPPGVPLTIMEELQQTNPCSLNNMENLWISRTKSQWNLVRKIKKMDFPEPIILPNFSTQSAQKMTSMIQHELEILAL